ncbi:substrate-binding domain-containing protein [Streptomyces sp. NBC_00873]|uniref:GntR family transcriptional regulator n=1 Tax=unclassified Streptomyces TaxID=2593676 RepID=UPI003869D885|nr:substrate-binding domain-containing protein [Streptomyces sp. NBC_00873]WTA48241.1 substrate-binding domain-containing protein [Streptomyces sp. NBC_00842]
MEARPQSARELKFRQLAAELRRRVLDGTWPQGSKLPTEQSLAAETGLSVTTVRRAYEVLVEQRLIERRQGAGTFASVRPGEARSPGRVVGVLVPTTSLYYPRVLQGVEMTLATAGARMVLACSQYDQGIEREAIERLVSSGVDGLLLVPLLHELTDPLERAAELVRLPVPVMLMERRLTTAGSRDTTEHVCTDHESGAYDAVRHLYDLGHRRIALVLRGDGPHAVAITSGFDEAAADLGLPENIRVSESTDDWDAEQADAAVAALQADGATAALCFGDREAALLLGAARRAGIGVPEDLALVSYDNEFADVAEIPLTAVSPPKYRLGRLAAEILLQRLADDGTGPVHQVQLRPRLVVRASCGGRFSWSSRSSC